MKRPGLIALLLPAALAGTPAAATTFCVDDANELQITLEAAMANGAEDDVIRIEAGIYRSTSPDGFHAYNYSDESATLEISGGWTSGCGLRLPGLRSTIDGELQRPGLMLGGTLDVRGTVIVRNMQFVRGLSLNDERAGGLTINRGYDIVVESNLFRENTHRHASGVAAGGLFALSEGSLSVRGNLFVDNDADTPVSIAAGAASLHCYGISVLGAFINNTVVGNSADLGAAADIGGVRVYGFSNCSWKVINNVLWDNAGLDLSIDVANTVLRFNDIADRGGSVPPANDAGNLSVDPRFKSDTDLRLQRLSPLVDAGTNTPDGGLPSASFDGGPRKVGPRVDMGAYELERLFANGFESSPLGPAGDMTD